MLRRFRRGFTTRQVAAGVLPTLRAALAGEEEALPQGKDGRDGAARNDQHDFGRGPHGQDVDIPGRVGRVAEAPLRHIRLDRGGDAGEGCQPEHGHEGVLAAGRHLQPPQDVHGEEGHEEVDQDLPRGREDVEVVDHVRVQARGLLGQVPQVPGAAATEEDEEHVEDTGQVHKVYDEVDWPSVPFFVLVDET